MIDFYFPAVLKRATGLQWAVRKEFGKVDKGTVIKLCLIIYITTTKTYFHPAKRMYQLCVVMQIESPSFKPGESIPSKFTCQGVDVNPTLTISNVPAQTKSLALIMDDPDAPGGTWVHWLLWNISNQTKEIPENSVPAFAVQGKNSWGKSKYGGPCPPSGLHRYFFKLYALDTKLSISSSADKKQLENAMKGHILATAELMGTYRKG